MYDTDNKKIVEPEEARRFFIKPKNMLISIIDDDDNSRISLFYGKSIHASDITSLMTSLRTTATKYAIGFTAQQYGQEIEPKDIAKISASIVENIQDKNMKIDIIDTEIIFGSMKNQDGYIVIAHTSDWHIDSYIYPKTLTKTQADHLSNVVNNRKEITSPPWVEDDKNSGIIVREGRLIEKAPHGEKAEHFITKHKKDFKERYGKKWKEVLYATAWKKFGESSNIVGDSLLEGMYGTTRSSYLKMENARMIVRHSKKIDENSVGSRGRCIEHIFIENAAGERMLYPSKHLAPARAMTQHVNNGGSFQDKVGESIIGMTEEYANLSKASKYVKRNEKALSEGCMNIREACTNKMKKMRKIFECLYKQNTYAKEAADVLQKSNRINEKTEIDENRISEVRQLLNDADLDTKVYESICKAMNENKEETPIIEEEKMNPVIKEHLDWLNSFNINKILMEDAWSDRNDYENDTEEAENFAIENFDVNEFIESESFKDIEISHDVDDSEDNKLTKDEIISAINDYISHYIQTYYNDLGEPHETDPTMASETLYERVCEALRTKGYIIEDDTSGLVDENNLDTNHFEDDLEEYATLDMEDIIIPKTNQGFSLAGEVTKKVVQNPNNNGMIKPDDSYIGRMATLAGLKNGSGSY